MIASLHTDDGEVAVEGLSTFAWEGIDVTEEEFRSETRVYPEVRLLGSGSIAERTLSKPSIDVLAFDAPRTNEVANQIVPTATAVVGLRMAPGEDYPRAAELVANHLRAAAPWGVRVAIEQEDPGAGLSRRHVVADVHRGARGAAGRLRARGRRDRVGRLDPARAGPRRPSRGSRC